TVDRDRAVTSLTTPDRFGAATFEEGPLTDALAAGRVPFQPSVTDPLGFASGALQYNFYLEPRAHADVAIAIPFHGGAAPAPSGSADTIAFTAERLDEAGRPWADR